MVRNKWDERFLDLARHVAGWSKDPSTQVGAVIVRPDRSVVSVGYNGFPRGVSDAAHRYTDKPTKYKMVVHAEANAIVAAKESLADCVLYVTLFPCNECAKLIIQSGIRTIVAPRLDQAPDQWAEAMACSWTMFVESGVVVRQL